MCLLFANGAGDEEVQTTPLIYVLLLSFCICIYQLGLTNYLILRLEAMVFSDTWYNRYERPPPTIMEDEHLRYPLQRENVGGHYNPYTMYVASGHSGMQQLHASSSRRTGSSDRNLPISSYYTFEGAARIDR